MDWADSDSVIEYLVEYSRMLAGEARRFDEARIRDLVGREVIRARDFAARENHDLLWRGPTGTRSSAPSSSTQAAAAE